MQKNTTSQSFQSKAEKPPVQQAQDTPADTPLPRLSPEKPTLLIVDIDAFYARQVSHLTGFFPEVQDFLEKNRDRFNVVHIWHKPEKTTLPKIIEKSDGIKHSHKTVQPVTDEQACAEYLPVTRPQKGEWILGKPEFSAFKKTDLSQHIPENSSVFIMGLYGYACIRDTIAHGLKNGHNIIALEDLVFDGCSANSKIKQKDFNPDVREYNAAVLTAMLP